MGPRDEYDFGMGLIRTMLGMVSIVVVLAASKTYTTIKENQQKEDPNRIEMDNDSNDLPYTALQYNDASLVVKTSSYSQGEESKQWVIFTDMDGNDIVADRSNVQVIGQFNTYEEAVQFINSNQLGQEVAQNSHIK